jgi:hypothetical protein
MTITDEPPVTTPATTGELNKALAAVQAELPRVEKKNTANTGSYSYDYADLADVSAAILPLLGKHGLAFTAWPTLNDDGKFVLAYSLLHSSGQERTGEYPLPSQGTPQTLGGVITYARRYTLCAVTGIAPGGDDNDAAGAPEHQMDAPRERRVRTAHSDPEHTRLRQKDPRDRVEGSGRVDKPADIWRGPDPDAPTEDQPGTASPGQVTAVQMAYKGLGFKNDEREQALAASEQILRRQLTGPNEGRTHKNLSHNEARRLRDTLVGFDGDREKLVSLLAAPLAAK